MLNVYRLDLAQVGSTVLDIGAGIGDFSVLASRKVGQAGKVIAVEPNPYDYATLLRNLDRNKCTNVQALNLAISGSEGVESFSFKGETFTANTKTMKGVLDDAGVDQVDFVKMDAEGSESVILPSSAAILEKTRYLSVELHGDQENVCSLLERMGFCYTPLKSSLATTRLLTFCLRHPSLSFGLYRKISPHREYRPFELARRLVTGLSITQEGRLVVALFSRGK